MPLHSKLDFRSLRKKRSKDLNNSMPDNPTASPVAELPSLPAAMNGPRHPQSVDRSTGREVKSFFNLHPPSPTMQLPRLKDTVKRLFSEEHFNHILADQSLFRRFSTFINKYQPQYVPTLIRYLDMRKALKAMEYVNSVTRRLVWSDKSDSYRLSQMATATIDTELVESSVQDLQILCAEVLPAFITQTLVGTVVDCIARDITGNTVPAIADLVGGLAEVFCLTDPSRKDNPIIHASEEFYHTTQYGMSYAINRNCRFLQGPETDQHCISRLARATREGKESCETILNYRRDGTPFVNLLMMAPLMDDMGKVKYFIGAQVDVTGLVVGGKGIESFRSLLTSNMESPHNYSRKQQSLLKDANPSKPLKILKELSQMFSRDEAEVVQQNIRDPDLFNTTSFRVDSKFTQREEDVHSISSTRTFHSSTTPIRKNRRIIGPEFLDHDPTVRHIATQLIANGLESPGYSHIPDLPGVYKHYLLVRPYPSLQIIFLSPSLRIPGLLRSNFFQKIGGPEYTMHSLETAFKDGASCTAKVLWLPKLNSNAEARPRWIRCNPLLGSDSQIGVWMVILIPIERPQELLDQPFASQQTTERSSSRQSRQSSVRSRSIDENERNYHGYDAPIRQASLVNIQKGLNKHDLAIRMPSGAESALESPVSPLGDVDKDLYADYMKPAPLPPLPRSTRDRDTSRTASFTSQSRLYIP